MSYLDRNDHWISVPLVTPDTRMPYAIENQFNTVDERGVLVHALPVSQVGEGALGDIGIFSVALRPSWCFSCSGVASHRVST